MITREQYLQSKLVSIQYKLDPEFDPTIVMEGITRDQYLAAQLERVNSEVPPCECALTTPDIGKSAYFGLRVECTGCGFTVEAVS